MPVILTAILALFISTSYAGFPPLPDMPLIDISRTPREEMHARHEARMRQAHAFIRQALDRVSVEALKRREFDEQYLSAWCPLPAISWLYVDCSTSVSIEPQYDAQRRFIVNLLPCAWA